MIKLTDSLAKIIHMPDSRRQVRQVSSLFLGLDHDATLAPFEAAPIDAKPLPGVALLGQGSRETAYILNSGELGEAEMQPYSCGFSNGILSSLFHDLSTCCNCAPAAPPFRHPEPSRPVPSAPAPQAQSA